MFYFIFIFIVLSVFIRFFYIMKTRRIVIDLNKNYDINLLLIKNLDEILMKSQLEDDIIDIRKTIPNSIKLKMIHKKGYGIIARKNIKKDEVIYKTPISCFHKSKNIKVITELGKRNVIPAHHCDGYFKDYILFDYWDIFLNHDFNHNARFTTLLTYNNGKLYQTLYAYKDIRKGDEITIDYILLYLVKFNALFDLF